MDRHEIEGHEVIEGEVKPTGNGARSRPENGGEELT